MIYLSSVVPAPQKCTAVRLEKVPKHLDAMILLKKNKSEVTVDYVQIFDMTQKTNVGFKSPLIA